jgi:hypothetical protein
MRAPFDGSMGVFHDLMQGFPLPADAGRALLFVVGLHGGCKGRTASQGARSRTPVAAHGLLPKPYGRLFVPGRRAPQSQGLAMLVHGALELAPRAFDLAGRPVPPPAEPHRPLAAGQGVLQRWAVWHHPPVAGRGLDVAPAFEPAGFTGAWAQGVGDRPADAQAHERLGKMRPLAAARPRGSPLASRCVTEREPTLQRLTGKFATKPSVVGVGVSRRDEKPLRALDPNHGHRASGVRAELVGCQAEKCLLLPGDDISPEKLTMPPVAIECVRKIRREALASFWEACHVAQQNVTKPDHIWFLGFIEDLVRAFDSAMETDKNRYGGT